jgi:hypothetical protein
MLLQSEQARLIKTVGAGLALARRYLQAVLMS